MTAALGARMAFEPGQGRSAVPVRSALAASTVALAAVIAAAVFGTSLLALVSTPHRYGQNWAQEVDLQFAGQRSRASQSSWRPNSRGSAVTPRVTTGSWASTARLSRRSVSTRCTAGIS